MLSEAALKKWMREHLRYEWVMVQHTHSELHRDLDQMTWNANFDAFALNAGNLHWFLTNKKGRADLPRKVRACDYVQYFKADDSDVANIISDLHEQVYHPGEQRLTADKAGRDEADKVFRWIDANMKTFVDQFAKTPFKSAWDADLADLSKVVPTSAEQRTDTNTPNMMSSEVHIAAQALARPVASPLCYRATNRCLDDNARRQRLPVPRLQGLGLLWG